MTVSTRSAPRYADVIGVSSQEQQRLMAATSKPAVGRVRAQGSRRGYRYYVLVVLALIALLNTFDQAILGVTTPAIQVEFGLADSMNRRAGLPRR